MKNDLISRQAAIDALNKHRALFCDNSPEMFRCLPHDEKCRVDEIDNAVATIVNLPSAQQWIPVTERLPKKYIGEWLCCDKYGNIFILRYENTIPNGDCVFCYTENDGYSVSVPDVVAWMPLPKPFREGGES